MRASVCVCSFHTAIWIDCGITTVWKFPRFHPGENLLSNARTNNSCNQNEIAFRQSLNGSAQTRLPEREWGREQSEQQNRKRKRWRCWRNQFVGQQHIRYSDHVWILQISHVPFSSNSFRFLPFFCGTLIWSRRTQNTTHLLHSPLNIFAIGQWFPFVLGFFVRCRVTEFVRESDKKPAACNLINIPSMFDSCLLDGRSRFTQIPHSSEHITRRHNWKQIKMSKRMGWLTSERAAPNVQILKGHRHCHQTFSAYVLTWHERENWCEYERAQKPDKENTCEFNSLLLHYCAIHVNFFGNNRLKKKHIVKLLPRKIEATSSRQKQQ